MQKTLNWNIIYKENSPKLLGICRRYVQDLATAEDILQDSFLKAIQNQHQLKVENALFSWLKKIVINNALLHLRKNKDFQLLEISAEFAEEEEEEEEENIEESNFLSHHFSREEMLASIDLLPSHHKAVFNLYFLENFSHTEIADQLGININTSKSHLLRAKKTIKAQLMNVNQPSTSFKKRGIQFLVFLGFGNLLWAKNFQNNFADFTIKPQKDFQPENSIKTFNENISVSNAISKKSIVKWTIAILSILILIFFVWNSDIISGKKLQNPKVNSTEKTDTNSLLNPEINPQKSTENSENTILNEKENPANREVQKPIIIKSEPLVQKEKPAKISETKEKIILRNQEDQNVSKSAVPIIDTTKTLPRKKVIVVKKIIKRDTVYIKK